MAPASVSTRRHIIEAYEYCCYVLAHAANRNELAIAETNIWEGDPFAGLDNIRKMDLMTLSHSAIDCAEYFKAVAGSQARHAVRKQDCPDGYEIPPYGEGSMFGYDSPTAAWLMLHPEGPAFLSRSGDTDLDEWISGWLEYWLFHPNPRTRWPTRNRINDAFEVPKLLEGNLNPGEFSKNARRLLLRQKAAIRRSSQKRGNSNGSGNYSDHR